MAINWLPVRFVLVALQVRRVAWESWPTLGKEDEEEEGEIEEEEEE